MKKSIILILAALAFVQVQAQTTKEEYKARYDRQVKIVGVSGVGVETILDRWAEAYPDDGDMLEGRFNYYLAKCQDTRMVRKDMDRFLGNKPTLSLKDSLGRPVNYFEEVFYEDSLFAMSATAIDKAISLYPQEFSYRIDKITALVFYEKESPDMATDQIVRLIDYNTANHPAWTYHGEPMDQETFDSTIQEYCYHLFRFGMPQTYEAFLTISEKMNKLHPKDPSYIDNIGSYWMVARSDFKKALKFYNKALKLDPKDYSAAKNCVLIARREKNVKLEKKYLPVLISSSPDESERLAGKARMEYLEGKKK